MDITQLHAALQASQAPIDRLRSPSEPGVYALFLANKVMLPGLSVPPNGLIYVGLSGGLAKRQFDTHFSSKQTGFSAIRRSLGALLKEQLRLIARPRGRGKAPQDLSCYRFEPDGEERLTEWMREHIHVAVHPSHDYQAIEGELISLTRPSLNLKGFANPDAREIKRLRKVCADEARRRCG